MRRRTLKATRPGCIRRASLSRRHRSTGSVSPNRFRSGDIVRFCSPLRRNLLPVKGDQHGEVIGLGMFGVTVRFYAFPDEPLYLGLNEIRIASGTRTARERAKASGTKNSRKKPNRSTEWI